jgi:hypothetical protein
MKNFDKCRKWEMRILLYYPNYFNSLWISEMVNVEALLLTRHNISLFSVDIIYRMKEGISVKNC